MTGFGKATGTFNSKKLSVEIRSLNSKSVDLNVRLPQQYKQLEAEMRKVVSKELGRGKIDLSISLEDAGVDGVGKLNREVAKKYYEELSSLGNELGVQSNDYMAIISRMPEVFTNSKEDLTEEESNWILSVIQDALVKINEFRRKEGEDLEKEYTDRINAIREELKQIPQFEQARIDTIKERMTKALEDLSVDSYDDNRFEQEMIFYIEKLDISEEKMRLANHLDYFLETMKLDQSGKKLGFISQEIGREINTLGSKSNHAEMQKCVIRMKDELEKIKEQVLNTL